MLRLALKNLWARKGRLLMSAVGVIASCAFLAGVFVFGDTIKGSFNRMFASAYRNTSVVVRSSNVIKAEFGSDTRDTVDTALVDQLAAVPGVKIASGSGLAFFRPGGSGTPQTACVSWYSFQPLPAR